MTAEGVVGVLTALSAVVVVLTRLRLTRPRAAGRSQVGMGWVNVHTVAGVVAVVAVLAVTNSTSWSPGCTAAGTTTEALPPEPFALAAARKATPVTTFDTVTLPVALAVALSSSVTVNVTWYVPGAGYVCWTGLPVPLPSPRFHA